jgi:hypothetical protein
MSRLRNSFSRPRFAVLRTTKLTLFASCVVASLAASSALGGVLISEFNSSSGVGNNEFVEFTNTGNTPVDMTGWSEDDSNRTANKAGHFLSAFGTLQPHESAIFTEATPDAFRTYWWGSVAAAPPGLKIIGPYTNDNLSSTADEINLYDSAAALIDRLTYPGTPAGGTANSVTRNPMSDAVLGLNQNSNWVNSSIGDAFGSFHAAGNSLLIGNPGSYPAVPEPATLTLGVLAIGAFSLVVLRRRGQRHAGR